MIIRHNKAIVEEPGTKSASPSSITTLISDRMIETLRSRTYTNPVYPDYFADPFAFRHDGVYYAIGTGPGLDDGDGIFRVLRSRDLVDWEPLGHALRRPDPSLGTDFWAPEVSFADGRFWMYYSVGHGDKGHQIRVAVSERPEGPYEDAGRLSDADCSFAIDAHALLDDDGSWYLFYARDFLDTDRPGTALVVDRLLAMDRLAGDPQVVMRATDDWQRYQAARSMYGGTYDWHTLEGPCVRKRDGRIYCFYSGGNWQNESYGLDYAVADHPLGPYEGGGSPLPRALRTFPGRVLGPGHNSIVTGPDGVTDYVVYHAWDPGMTGRRMCIDPLVWTSEGPRCDGPSYEPREIALE
jgi:beta-xylosidase